MKSISLFNVRYSIRLSTDALFSFDCLLFFILCSAFLSLFFFISFPSILILLKRWSIDMLRTVVPVKFHHLKIRTHTCARQCKLKEIVCCIFLCVCLCVDDDDDCCCYYYCSCSPFKNPFTQNRSEREKKSVHVCVVYLILSLGHKLHTILYY